MSSHTLTNLLSVANMTISGATESGGVFTFPAGVFCMINHSLPVPTAGHLYYGRVDQKVPSGTTFGDGRFEYFGGDGEGKNIVFTSFWDALQDNQWHTYSDILSFPYVAGENWTLRSFTVNGSQTVYRQRHMIIDLTAAFGAGNEPTKDWCDRCIPFFEGTIGIISAASGYVGIGGAAKKLATGYVGVNGVAKKIVAGYVGVNGVAKSIWGGGVSIDPIDFIEGNFTTYENDLVTSIGEYAFGSCGTLTDISFPNATSIRDAAFNDCGTLRVLRIGLQKETVCTIYYTYSIAGTVPSTIQTIYVPATLVDAYKADTNWSKYADKIVGV